MQLMDVFTRLKVDIQGYLRVVYYLGGKKICSNAWMNLISWKVDYYLIDGSTYEVTSVRKYFKESIKNWKINF